MPSCQNLLSLLNLFQFIPFVMSHKKEFISLNGLKKLEAELHNLHQERETAVKAVAEGREHGDLRENAEYQSAREWQNNVESKIATLSHFIKQVEPIDVDKLPKDGAVRFGSFVGLRTYDPDRTMKVQILGEKEADFNQQQISINSPLAKALIGKKAGDVIVVEAPSGSKEYEILEVL